MIVDLHRVRRPTGARRRHPQPRQRDADPLLVGLRRDLLEPAQDLSNFYLVTYASVAGDDPNEDVQALQEALAAQDPALLTTGSFVTGAATIDAIVEAHRADGRHRRRRARRRRSRASGRADDLRRRQLLARAARGVRPRVPRDADPGRRAQLRRARAATSPADIRGGSTRGWPTARSSTDRAAARRTSPGRRRLAPLRGRARARRRHARAPPPRGRRPDRAERRREDDARERHDGLRLPERGHGAAGGHGHHGLARRTAGHVPGWRERSSTATSSAVYSVRENVAIGALGAGASPAASERRADELLDMLGLRDRADSSAAILPHGDERKLGVARALASKPSFVLMDEPAAGLHEGEVADFAGVVRRVRDEREAGVLLIDHNIASHPRGVRPHLRARRGKAARGGHARRRSAATPTWRPPTSAGAGTRGRAMADAVAPGAGGGGSRGALRARAGRSEPQLHRGRG